MKFWNMFAVTLGISMIVWGLSGCDGEKGPVIGEVGDGGVLNASPSAEQKSSVPPPGGWENYNGVGQPWLCSPASYRPSHTSAWPDIEWCQWQPQAGVSILPYRVTACNGEPWAPGIANIYSGDNYTGSCAQVYGDVSPTGYVFDTDLVRVNGWITNSQDPFGLWIIPHTRIRSVRVAAHSYMIMCEGPTNAAGVCTTGITFQAGAVVANTVPHVNKSDGSPFNVASFVLVGGLN